MSAAANKNSPAEEAITPGYAPAQGRPAPSTAHDGLTAQPSPVHRLWRSLMEGFRGDGPDFEQSRRLLARSVVLTELDPPGASKRLLWLIIALVVGFALWASVIELDEVASAPGEILPAAHVQPVQHLEGGIVSRIHVLDGQEVERGQILVSLDGRAAVADLERARARQTSLKLQAERLLAFSQGRPGEFGAGEFAALRSGEAAILSSQASSRNAQLAIVDAQVAEKRSEFKGLVSRETSLRQQIGLLQQDMAARKPLVDRGLISKLSYLAMQRDLSRLQGDLAETLDGQQRARASIEEAGRSRIATGQRLRADAMREYGDVAGQLAQADQEVARLQDQVSRLDIRAPVAGVVKGLAALGERQVLPAGALVAEIVPAGGQLIAEVKVSPGDIGHVRVGSPVMVKVATYDFARNGGIDGTVAYVSAASFVDQQGHPYFKARVNLASDHVGPKSKGLLVSPGMTVVADVKTGSKTLTAYLFKPVTNALMGAFTER